MKGVMLEPYCNKYKKLTIHIGELKYIRSFITALHSIYIANEGCHLRIIHGTKYTFILVLFNLLKVIHQRPLQSN